MTTNSKIQKYNLIRIYSCESIFRAFDMELELHRVDYYSVGPTLVQSMKLLPASYKEQQRVS